MGYSKEEIGKQLKTELEKGYDIHRIASWADNLFNESRGDLNPELREILQYIFLMDAGPEFVHSEEALKKLAEKLISDRNNQ